MLHNIRGIDDLPSIHQIRRRAQGLALLDAILMPDWEGRYFSFNSKWNEADGEMMASMRDGSGGEYFLHFSRNGVVGKVFDGQALLDSELFLALIPDHFSSFKGEPAFKVKDATFYFWQSKGCQWMAAPSNLGSYPGLRFLREGAAYYHEWAESYYERDIDLKTLVKVFDSLCVTDEQLTVLNSDLTVEDLAMDLQEILK